MSKKVPPRVLFEFESDAVDEEVNAETGEMNQNFIYDGSEGEDEQEETIEDRMPAFVEKPKILREDIFDLPSLVEKEALVSDSEEEPVHINRPKALKKLKVAKQEKIKKPRKPMTEEHKAKLGKAREKALIVRRRLAEERKQMKAIDTETTQLNKQKKVNQFNQLKEEVTGEPHAQAKPAPSTPSMTKKDLEEAQFEAIVRYETLRKARKEEKRKQQAIDKTKEELMKKIQPKKGYAYRDGSNRWDMCY